MPSIRKRIGYLPSINAQELITKIANKEKLSQSKVVGILVEEALIARRGFDLRNSNALISKKIYEKGKRIHNSSINCNDLDELISDKGVTYNTRTYKYNSDVISSETNDTFDEELFEHFKQFVLFQKWYEKNK